MGQESIDKVCLWLWVQGPAHLSQLRLKLAVATKLEAEAEQSLEQEAEGLPGSMARSCLTKNEIKEGQGIDAIDIKKLLQLQKCHSPHIKPGQHYIGNLIWLHIKICIFLHVTTETRGTHLDITTWCGTKSQDSEVSCVFDQFPYNLKKKTK